MKITDKRHLYWLAGILEAEGSFLAPSPSDANVPRISISMTDEDIIAHVADLFGVKYQTLKRRNEKHKTPYATRLKGYRAAVLMRELYPLMSKRRRGQIDRALANYRDKPDKKGQNAGFVKLTDGKVREIKRRLASGETQKTIAQEFGVSRHTISDINCSATWLHVQI